MPWKPLQRNENAVALAVALLAGLTIVGAGGFFVLGHGERSVFDSFWMTMQILTTVGDTGLQRTEPDRIWSFLLMVVGVRSSAGSGAWGGPSARHFIAGGAQFVVVDNADSKIEEAARLDYPYIQGDAMTDEILEQARIRQARGLATCLPEDADNVFVTLTACDLAPKLTIVAKANYEDTHSKLTRAGASHVLSPNKLAAVRAMTKFMLPAVDELALPSRASVIVVAIVDEEGRRSFNPKPDTRLAHGDELIVIGAAGAMERMVELFGEKETA